MVVRHSAICRLFDDVPDVGCPIWPHHEVVGDKLTSFDCVLLHRDDLDGFVGFEPSPDDLRRGRRRVRLHDFTRQQRPHPYIRRENGVQAVEITGNDRIEETACDRRTRRARAVGHDTCSLTAGIALAVGNTDVQSMPDQTTPVTYG